MATTLRQLLDAAYGKNAKNQPDYIATEGTELVAVANRIFYGLFAKGARVNPAFFGGRDVVALDGDGWPRPAAESIFRIENADGDEVVEVPLDDKEAETGKPAVYAWGQVYYSAGNALDPTTEDLTFFYARRPEPMVDVDSEADALWPEQFNEIPILGLALYLAEKEDRDSEAQRLMAERDAWEGLYLEFLEHESTVMVRRMGTTFQSPVRSAAR